MRTVYLRNSPFGLEYRTETGSTSWRPLPTECKTQEAIKQYFMEGRDQPTRGRFDPPVIAFVNEEGQPCTYYQVTKDKRIHTNFDPSKSLYPDPDYFRTTLQQIDFLRAGMDAETISQGQDLETAKEERDFLLKKARPETQSGFQTFITEGMNPENIENFCYSHARERHNTGSVVIFEE